MTQVDHSYHLSLLPIIFGSDKLFKNRCIINLEEMRKLDYCSTDTHAQIDLKTITIHTLLLYHQSSASGLLCLSIILYFSFLRLLFVLS